MKAAATCQLWGRARGLTKAGLVVPGEARGTVAGEGADGVGAEELAVVLPGGALVQVCGTDSPRRLRAGNPRAGDFPGERPQGWRPTPHSGREGMSGWGCALGISGGPGTETHRAWGGRHLCRSCRPPPAGSLGDRSTRSCPRCFCRGRHTVWGPGHTRPHLEGRQHAGASHRCSQRLRAWGLHSGPKQSGSMGLHKELALFPQKPENKHSWLCTPHGFSSNYSTLLLWWESSHKGKGNKQAWLCANKTLLTKPSGGPD